MEYEILFHKIEKIYACALIFTLTIARISCGNSVCLSVCLSVCHDPVPI